jgi:2-octaprenyl-6-methoxyphenol hydroxylase
MSMDKMYDVVIAGGGMVGLSLALGLEQGGLSVAVIDREPLATQQGSHFDGRASALAFASWAMLDALGVADRIGEAQPINDILVTDGRPGTHVVPGAVAGMSLHFDSREMASPVPDQRSGKTGASALGWMVENRQIRAALAAELATRTGITLLAPAGLARFEIRSDGVPVWLDDGRMLHCRVLIGADGRGSQVARQSRIRSYGWDYRQSALVTTVAMEKPHNGVAHEVFLPGGPFAILPLTGNRANIVWSEDAHRAAALAKLSPAGFAAELSRRFGDFLGQVSLVAPVWHYPLSLRLTADWYGPRMALCGDAAHVIHPIAGQGFNLGLKDAAALAQVLCEAVHLGEDPGSVHVLERYARWRRADTMTLAVSCDAFVRLFSNDIGPVRALRTLGLGLVDAIGPARRFFATHAGGGAGDLPDLMQGRPLKFSD